MIRVWRLCQAVHSETAFDGEGARRFGGRWNHRGLTAIYTASTQSLAALEVLAHADSDLLVNEYLFFAVDIPAELAIEEVRLTALPHHWRDSSPPIECQRLGSDWLTQSRTPVLSVPSAIIPTESNFILNPRHTDFVQLKIHEPTSFKFDARLLR